MTRCILRYAALTLAFVCGFTSLHAQSALASLRPAPQSNRVPANADFGPQTQLTGHLPGWVSKGVATSKPVDLNATMHLTLLLQRDPTVQAAFTQFLQDQQTPGNPLYHQWLTPQQVGALFGPTASDVAAVTNWLTVQGLVIDSVEPNQIMINVHGSTSVVASAFRTSFAYFPLNGEERRSAVNEPYIPTALGPVVASIYGLTDVPFYPHSVRSGPVQLPSAGSATTSQPQYTSSTGAHYMTPGDFAIVYDVNSVYSAGNKGGGNVTTNGTSKANSVAIIGQSRVAATDISEFAALTGIGSSYTLNTVIPGASVNGADPGPVCTIANAATCSTGDDQGEQTLDVDRVLGTAPGAVIDLIANSASTSTGIQGAMQWNVSTLVDPVMTISYGGCEAVNSQSTATFFDSLFSTAASEGISTFVSSDDSGVNGCAPGNAANTKVYTASMNVLCSSSWVTCVGGTEFNDTTGSYWGPSTGYVAPLTSALSYIPEGAWNEPGTTAPFLTSASGGGPSIYISKPTWQAGTGVPNDGARDTPDVAYPAAIHDGYLACLDYATGSASKTCPAGYAYIYGGTSAAAPAMAGVAALLNAKLGTAQGNLNPLLYKLAATTSNGVFHDITPATSGVGTCSLTVPSMCNNSTPGSSALSTTATGGQQGYAVQAGYDMVTGLGSIDVANLLTAAAATKVSTTLALTTVSPNPVAVSTTVTLTSTLTRSSTTPGAATGTVSFYYTPTGGSATLIGSAVTISNNVATTTTTFSTAGTYTITAVYSGDTNYATSLATGVSLVVNPGPSFTVVPVTTTYNLISGATTGNTDVITLTSTNSFVGSVVVTCAVTNVSGTAAGSCTQTTPVTLTSGNTGTSTLTITTIPGTSGVLNVTVTGTSGTTVVTSSTITVNLTASSYTLAALPTTISIAGNATTGNTTSVTITSVNGFAGTVTVSCASSLTTIATCTGGSAAVTASTPGHVTVIVTPIIHTSGTATLTLSGSGVPTGGTIAATTSTTVGLTVTTVGSTTTVVAAPTTVVSGSPTTLTATITGASINGNPTGLVTFYAGATTIGTGTASTTAGVTTATYVYTPSAPSSTPVAITATYAGDTGYAGSTSAAANLTITGTTASPGTANLPSFTSGATTGNTDTVTFTSVSGFAGTITVACNIVATAGSPAIPATCAPNPTSVPIIANGTATSTITITSTTAQAHSAPLQAGLGTWGLRGGAMVAMLLCLVPFRRRRFVRTLAAFVLMAGALVALSGCGGSAAAAVKKSSAGTYTVTTTGTSGTETASTTFTVTIN